MVEGCCEGGRYAIDQVGVYILVDDGDTIIIVLGQRVMVEWEDEGGGEGQYHEGPEGDFQYGLASLW